MAVSFNGYKREVITFEADSVTVGAPVIMASNGAVKDATDGGDIIGIALNNRGGVAGVQTDGYVEVAYTGTAPTVGFTGLVSNGAGGVKSSTSAVRKYKVLKVDTDNTTVGFIL